jgi:uncharacterized protein YjiK
MKPGWRAALAAICLVAGTACQAAPDDLGALIAGPTAVARAARLAGALANHDSSSGRVEPIARWLLPPALREISGLALTHDGRLLVHDDQLGQVWEVDYRRGVLVKRFSLGNGVLKGDFEGITVANDMVYLLNSNGKLYEFPEGANGAQVDYKLYDTGLKQDCEFEGVAFDPAIDALLLACKHVHDKDVKDDLVIYRWSLKGDSATRLSRLAVPIAKVRGDNDWDKLEPSDISIDPVNGNYLLIASLQQAVFEITPAGEPVFARMLPPGHRQPEGVAVTKDSVLLVSDEGGNGTAMITLYRWP